MNGIETQDGGDLADGGVGEALRIPLGSEARPPPLRAALLLSMAALALALAFAVVFRSNWQARATLEKRVAPAAQAALVSIVASKRVEGEHAFVLPGTLKAFEEVVVHSRANGYLRRWAVDIGDQVREGDVLAEIDTPELDAEIAQGTAELARARATVLQVVATRNYSVGNAKRYDLLAPEGLASLQDVEQKHAQGAIDTAAVTVARTTVDAQRANLDRLRHLKEFARVVAPFSGVVRSRTAARGTVVVAGQTALFEIMAIDPVRVFVQVPQGLATSVRVGSAAKVTVRDFPGRTFEGKVTRTSGALDPGSRTLMTEILVPNPANELLTGMYVQVAIPLTASHDLFELPASALFNDANGSRVASVVDGKLHFLPVVVERDTGGSVQISNGLDGTEKIVRVANAGLVPDIEVKILDEPPVHESGAPPSSPRGKGP